MTRTEVQRCAFLIYIFFGEKSINLFLSKIFLENSVTSVPAVEVKRAL